MRTSEKLKVIAFLSLQDNPRAIGNIVLRIGPTMLILRWGNHQIAYSRSNRNLTAAL
jgi:hypothetical protein